MISDQDLHIRQSLDLLAQQDDAVKEGLRAYGYPRDRSMPASFETLAKIIVGQQISRIVATSIWQKMAQADCTTAPVIATMTPQMMQRHGLSLRKSEYIIGLAHAIVSGKVNLTELATLEPSEVRTQLVALRGIGNWTADNFRLFALGDMDAWPGNDIALQEGMRRLKTLHERPNAAMMDELAESWRPYRGAGALFLWHLYAIEVRKATPSDI